MKCRFARRQAVKFGAYIRHASRDQHASDMGWGLIGFQNSHDPQRPAG